MTAETGQPGQERRYRPAVSSIQHRTPRQGNLKVKKEKIANFAIILKVNGPLNSSHLIRMMTKRKETVKNVNRSGSRRPKNY
jgi:hypothetical protein